MTRAAPRLRYQIIAMTATRAVINTAHRMVYPFLPEFSRGLGVPLYALTLLLSARAAVGMTAPFFGGLPDRFGRRQAMLVGLGLFCLGLALAAGVPTYPAFFAAVILIVVAKFIFDPAMQAYLGDRTPYARRGLVIGLTELGWSAAALAGIPLAGFLIARGTWRAPFWPIVALGVLAGVGLWLLIPRDAPAAEPARRKRWAVVWRNPAALAALSIGLFISTANESLLVVYGVWMERGFGLGVAALGLSTTVIGVAELAGEGLVMSLVDRLGKRRAIAAGALASALAYAALPLAAFSLPMTLAALFVVFVAFEFTIVASIPLMTEVVPEARGAVMSANVGFHAAGRMLGALLGGFVFQYGFVWNGLAAAAVNLIALAVVVGLVREQA